MQKPSKNFEGAGLSGETRPRFVVPEQFTPLLGGLRLERQPQIAPRRYISRLVAIFFASGLVWNLVAQSNQERRAEWRGKVLTLVAGVLAVVALDQATKAMVAARMSLGESIPVVPGLLHFTLVRNTGMAFGLLSGADVPYKSVLMTLGRLVALAAVAYYTMRSPQGEKLTHLVLILVFGGAIGNLIDGIRFGYVIDFVDVFYRDSHWPAFNVADASISIGVGLILFESLRRREPALPRAADVATGGDR